MIKMYRLFNLISNHQWVIGSDLKLKLQSKIIHSNTCALPISSCTAARGCLPWPPRMLPHPLPPSPSSTPTISSSSSSTATSSSFLSLLLPLPPLPLLLLPIQNTGTLVHQYQLQPMIDTPMYPMLVHWYQLQPMINTAPVRETRELIPCLIASYITKVILSISRENTRKIVYVQQCFCIFLNTIVARNYETKKVFFQKSLFQQHFPLQSHYHPPQHLSLILQKPVRKRKERVWIPRNNDT